MSKRLVKVAQEFNVATSTLVELLLTFGFEVENKPAQKLTEGMIEVISMHYSPDTEKEQLDIKLLNLRGKEYTLDCKYKTLRDTGKKLTKDFLGDLYEDMYKVYASHLTEVEEDLRDICLKIKMCTYDISSL